MNLNLQENVIIVTGGASGIGESISKKIADEGGIPCIADRNQESAIRVAREIEVKGGRCLFILTELTEIESCKDAIEQILFAYGKIDGIVNNAGLNDGVSLEEEGNYQKFLFSLKRNAGHYFTMVNLILPFLKQSKGAIVDICSEVAFTGKGGTSEYAAVNGMRLGLTKNWAKEFSPFGIRVNAVVIAECLTPQYQWWINQEADPSAALKEITAVIPLGNRLTTSEEIADTVLFLLSPKSTLINGQYWNVDGGYVHLDRKIHSNY